MVKVNVTEIEEGMTLASDVCDDGGRPLLGAGTELSPSHAKSLMRRGIMEVEILAKGEAVVAPGGAGAAGGEAAVVPEKIEAQLAEIEHVFEHVKDQPLMAELYGLARTRAERGALGD